MLVPPCDDRKIDTRSSSFSSSCAVRDDMCFFSTRFRVVAMGMHSLPRRWHLSQLPPLGGRKMHLHLAREQLVHDLP